MVTCSWSRTGHSLTSYGEHNVGLSYGSYPDKVSKTLKISLAAAQSIFDNYHNVLYPGITDYRENYVLTTAKSTGRLHLGLGCYIYTDNARRDIRTLHNA